MGKINRKRDRAVTLRMTDSEYDEFNNKVSNSGLSRQDFFIRMIKEIRINSAESLGELKRVNDTLSNLDRQLRGMATNVNQMARIANGTGMLPSEKALAQINQKINEIRKELGEIWQSIRSSIRAG